jgi:hypothetical protein
MKTLLALMLLTTPVEAQVDPCYRPPMPELCVPKTDQMGDHVRCLVVDRVKLLQYIRRLDAYYTCRK